MNIRTGAVLTACFFTILAAFAVRYTYGTLLPEMLLDLNISKTQAGVIYSSYFIVYTLLAPVLGLLADRFNLRVLLTVFVILMGTGAFLMQYPHSVLQATLFFALAGIGCAACWVPVMALAQRWINPARRGMSLAFIDAGSSLGVITAGALVPLVVSGSDWKTGWLAIGLFTILLGMFNYVLVRDHPEGHPVRVYAGEQPGRIEHGGYREVLRDRKFWLIGLSYLLTGFTIIIPFTFLTTYTVQERHISHDLAALLITVIGAGGMTGKLVLGPASDKLGRIRIMVLCAFLIGGGCAAMIYSSGWIYVPVCFIYGIGYGACWSMYAACAPDFFSDRAVGGIIGLWTFLMGIGSIIAPIITGWSADLTGSLKWAFVIAAGGGAGSFLLLLPLWKAGRVEGRG
ncbi:MAG: MFS transporter [Dehalococcoidales bacterium]|nr:MFS transporter [Dehalococcoidales bacterium]